MEYIGLLPRPGKRITHSPHRGEGYERLARSAYLKWGEGADNNPIIPVIPAKAGMTAAGKSRKQSYYPCL